MNTICICCAKPMTPASERPPSMGNPHMCVPCVVGIELPFGPMNGASGQIWPDVGLKAQVENYGHNRRSAGQTCSTAPDAGDRARFPADGSAAYRPKDGPTISPSGALARPGITGSMTPRVHLSDGAGVALASATPDNLSPCRESGAPEARERSEAAYSVQGDDLFPDTSGATCNALGDRDAGHNEKRVACGDNLPPATDPGAVRESAPSQDGGTATAPAGGNPIPEDREKTATETKGGRDEVAATDAASNATGGSLPPKQIITGPLPEFKSRWGNRE